MKKLVVFTLLAAACLSLVSCNRNELTPQEGGSDVNTDTEEDIFWGVVGNLVNRNDITPDFKGKTFKPIIGEPDNGDESVRIVSVNTPAVAAARYNALTGASITETTRSHSWHNDLVGSLTWTLVEDNTAWATVDVNIPSVPGLHKIIYRSPDQGDVNGSVGDDGSAYYRFGDVIKRKRAVDNVEEYWICVRPSFGPEGKGKSHWISVSPLPKEDVWPYYEKDYNYGPFVASNRMEYGIPKHLGHEMEWHQDLAEMLFAIMYPETWKSNIDQYSTSSYVFDSPSGLPIFNGWHFKRVKYHNEAFWTNVQNQWKARDLVPFLFGITYDEMAAALNPNNANARGLHFLYEGSKWSIKTSNKPTLYQVHYTNGEGNEEKNMHKETKKSVSSQVVVPRNFDVSNTNYPFDVYKVTSAQPFLSEARFFGDDAPRWIVRYRTGAELSSTGNYDPQQPIPGFTANDEIYRYYKHVFPEKNLTDEPEITVEGKNYGFVGKPHYRWGNVYKDEMGCKWFVINQSGYKDATEPELTEASTYSELVSFDAKGFDATVYAGADGPAKVSNLPSLDVAIRATMFLYLLYNQTVVRPTDASLNSDVKYGKSVLNIMQSADVDARNLMQCIVAQNNDVRASSYACCVAYAGKGSAQPLFRLVVNIQNERNDPQFYFWTRYPNHPDQVTQFVQDFSHSLIYLQDIKDQAMVDKYAVDTYAIQPLSRFSQPDSDERTPRLRRVHADERAAFVDNYYYDRETFTNLAYPGSMWNEPVLVFRYTRVRDLGDDDYSKTTVDGHKLTLLSEREWNSPLAFDEDAYYESVREYPRLLLQMVGDAMYLNGQPYHMVKWEEIKDEDLQNNN